ncbi:MAG: glucose-phosphate cytidylyltransferase [Myxococcales bacterium]|nr:glucose-phosphate cytidylyltransferase [Myxococcales bacterium]
MKVVILCGGLGTRLREETEFRPKPLVEIGGRPILWHIMKIFGHQGLREFVLCLGYKGSLIKEYFLNYEAMTNDIEVQLGERSQIKYLGVHEEQDWNVRLVETGATAGTGARVARAQPHVGPGRFMVTYGDGLIDINLEKLHAFHASHGRLATVTTVRVPGRFGVIDTGDDGAVQRFREKPTEDAWISAGYFVFEPSVFEYVWNADDCILERDPLERLVKDGQLMAYRHTGEFHPMDTYRDHVALNELWSSGKAPWKIW